MSIRIRSNDTNRERGRRLSLLYIRCGAASSLMPALLRAAGPGCCDAGTAHMETPYPEGAITVRLASRLFRQFLAQQ
jgi:hypothetical protein